MNLQHTDSAQAYVSDPRNDSVEVYVNGRFVPRREAVPVAEREDPSGAGPWVKRARRMQGQMIANWAGRYL